MRNYLILILFFVIFLLGCASVSPSYTYRPANYDGPAWSISAYAEEGLFKDTISITINGEHVVGGSLHEFKPRDNFRGAYLGRQILAECELVESLDSPYLHAHECTVFVDNERVAFLKF